MVGASPPHIHHPCSRLPSAPRSPCDNRRVLAEGRSDRVSLGLNALPFPVWNKDGIPPCDLQGLLSVDSSALRPHVTPRVSTLSPRRPCWSARQRLSHTFPPSGTLLVQARFALLSHKHLGLPISHPCSGLPFSGWVSFFVHSMALYFYFAALLILRNLKLVFT